MHQVAPVSALKQTFEKVGVSNGSHVVVYASDAPMAARAAFTLDYLGGVTVSFLDGGIAGWRAAARRAKGTSPARINFSGSSSSPIPARARCCRATVSPACTRRA